MVGPWLDPHDLIGEIEPRRLFGIDPVSDEYLCSDCGRRLASLPHLIDHLERRH